MCTCKFYIFCGGVFFWSGLFLDSVAFVDILLNRSQQLFSSCTARFADGQQCSVPVFDITHQTPLCDEHAKKMVIFFFLIKFLDYLPDQRIGMSFCCIKHLISEGSFCRMAVVIHLLLLGLVSLYETQTHSLVSYPRDAEVSSKVRLIS